MGRDYTKLRCGCYISCGGGGGLIPCDYHRENPSIKGEALREYQNKHIMFDGECVICSDVVRGLKVCPNCGSTNHRMHNQTPIDDNLNIEEEMFCRDCETSWINKFDVVFKGYEYE